MKIEINIGRDPASWSEAGKILTTFAAVLMQGTTINTSNVYTVTGTAPIMPPSDDSEDNGAPDATAPQFDNSGLPWDARIHSANKSRTDDGMWRSKRKLDPNVKNAVEAELRQRSGQNNGMYMQPGQQVQQQPQVTQVSNPQPMPQQMPQQYQQPSQQMPQGQQPMPQQMPQGQPQYQQPQQPVALDANGFMTHLSNQMQVKMTDGVTPMIDQNYLINALPRMNQMLAQNGMAPLNIITDVLNMPQAIPIVVSIMTQDGRW